jgi:MFS family permease
MTTEFAVGTVAAATTAALAFLAAWRHWRAATAESLAVSAFLIGIAVGALSGPAIAGVVAALSGNPLIWELAAPFGCVGVLIGGVAGRLTGKRIGRPSERPTQDEQDYEEPGSGG